MKRVVISLWCISTYAMQEYSPEIQKALLSLEHEKNHKAWKYFREEEVFINKHTDCMDFIKGDSDIKLFEAVYTQYTGGFAPSHTLQKPYYTFHDKYLIYKNNYEYTIKTYCLNKNNEFEACALEKNPRNSRTKEKYWIRARRTVGIVKCRTTGKQICIVQPLSSGPYVRFITLGRNNKTAWECLSSFDEKHGVLVTIQQADKDIHNLVICKFLQDNGDLIEVLKHDVGESIADVIIRNNIVMILTIDGRIFQFYPYHPTYFEVQPHKITRGCDTSFTFQ